MGRSFYGFSLGVASYSEGHGLSICSGRQILEDDTFHTMQENFRCEWDSLIVL